MEKDNRFDAKTQQVQKSLPYRILYRLMITVIFLPPLLAVFCLLLEMASLPPVLSFPLGFVVLWFITRKNRLEKCFEEPINGDGEEVSNRIIVWWEKRRLTYNLIVGITGITSLVLFLFFLFNSGHLKPGEDAIEPMGLMVAVLFGPLIINCFYSLGWIAELILWRLSIRSPRIGPALYIAGTSFSIFVLSFPALFWGLALLGLVTPPNE